MLSLPVTISKDYDPIIVIYHMCVLISVSHGRRLTIQKKKLLADYLSIETMNI
jgi:hypothetical protein